VNEQMNERWYQVCQQAVAEPDSDKFFKLVEEVNLLLDARDAQMTAFTSVMSQ
jgi:hypothetical protein